MTNRFCGFFGQQTTVCSSVDISWQTWVISAWASWYCCTVTSLPATFTSASMKQALLRPTNCLSVKTSSCCWFTPPPSREWSIPCRA